ncbi:MAG: MFS transporter [Bacilli bacterium]|nr:MFS transporter [Bacilli bacterium]
MSKKRLLLTTCPLYLFFYMGDAFLTSYYSLYFMERGMEPGQVSILLGVIPFALFLGCFLLSPIAKNPKRALILFQLCALFEAGLSFAYSYCDNFVSLLLVTIAVAFFDSAPFSFIEGYVAPLAKKANVSFSTIRLFGTIGYIISLLLGYFVLSALPIRDCFYFASLLFLLAFGVSFLIPSHRKLQNSRDNPAGNEEEKKPLFNKNFVMFLLFNLFFFGAFNAMLYVLPIRLTGLGLTEAEYSLARSIGICGELVMLLLTPLFVNKLKGRKLPIIISALFIFLASSFGIFIFNAYGLGYSALVMSSVGKAFFFAFESYLLMELVGERNLAKALVVISASSHLTSTLLNLASNSIYENWTYSGYFGLIAGLEAIGIVFLLLIKRNGENLSSPSSSLA